MSKLGSGPSEHPSDADPTVKEEKKNLLTVRVGLCFHLKFVFWDGGGGEE